MHYNKEIFYVPLYWIPNSLSELKAKSDYIVSGRPLNSVNELNSLQAKSLVTKNTATLEEQEDYLENSLMYPTFISKVRVESITKGNIHEKEINIVYNYAIKDKILYNSELSKPSFIGLEYMFYLNKMDAARVKVINREFKSNYKELYVLSSSINSTFDIDGRDKENLKLIKKTLTIQELQSLNIKVN